MNINGDRINMARVVRGLTCIILVAWPGGAGAAGEEQLPADTAVLELDVLQQGARVWIDGEEVAKYRWTYKPFQPERRMEVDVLTRFADGQEARRKVILKGGWHVRVPIRSVRMQRPELVLQSGHTDHIDSMALSRDGKWLLTGGWDKTAILWDVTSGSRLRSFQGHSERLTSVAISSNGKWILTVAIDNKAILWESETGRKVRSFQLGNTLDYSLAFSPDSKWFIVGSADKTVDLWNVQTGQKLRSFQGHEKPIRSVAFSPDGQQILTGSDDQTAILWNVSSGEKLRTFQGHAGGINDLAFSPDGRQILTGSTDKTAILWDASNGQQLQSFQGHTGSVYGVAFTSDGKQIVTGSADNSAILWNVANGQKVRTFDGHTEAINGVAAGPDGKNVLTASRDNTAILWDASTGQKVRAFQDHSVSIRKVSLSDDGRWVSSTTKDQYLIQWDTATGQMLPSFQDQSGSTSAVKFSPDGKQVVIGAKNGTAMLRDVITGQKLHTFQDLSEPISSIAFSPDGQGVIITAMNRAVIWNTKSGEKVSNFQSPSRSICGVAFSPDGRSILTREKDDAILLWDVSNGRFLRTVQRATGDNLFSGIGALVFSPDGKWVVYSEGASGSATMLDATNGRRLRTFEHPDGILLFSVAFSPDASLLLSATAGGDRAAILWDAATGQKLRTFQGPPNGFSSVAFSPNGRWVLTASDDGVHYWDAATGDEVAHLIALKDKKDWLVVTPEGLFDGSEGGRQKVAYRVGAGLTVAAVDRFFQDFYRPGLLAAVRRGDRLMPDAEFAQQRPPLLRILSPRQGGLVKTDNVTMDVEVEDQGGGVQGPWLVQNGARVLAPGTTEKRDKILRRTFTIGLIEGDNHIEIRAASGDSSWESEPARITLRHERPLDKARLHLIAVGINRYADEPLSLKYARPDAEAMAELFRRRGKALYQSVEIELLADDKATRDGIRQALQQAAKRAQPQDTLLVFLAGHGAMVGQRYYFIPHDFRRQEGKSMEAEIRQQGLAADVLGDWVGAVPALKRVLVFDTCQSGGAVGLGAAGRNAFAFRGAIERLSRAQGVFTIAATAASDDAQEVKELGHGALTYSLLAGLAAVQAGPLEGKAVAPANPERVVEVLEWFNYASGQVPRLTKRYLGQEQNVQVSGQGQSFPVLPLEEK